MKLTLGKRHLFLLIVMLLLFRQLLGSNVSLVFGYTDEIFAVICFFVIIHHILSNKIKKEILFSFTLLIILLGLGILSTIYSGISQNIIANLLDAFAFSKFILIFWGGVILCKYCENTYTNWKSLANFSRIFVLIALFFSIINFFVDIGMHTDYRYGLRAFQFIFNRVGGLYSACICFLMIQTMDIAYFGINTYKKVLLIVTLVVMCSTLRARAFAYTFMYVAGYYFAFNYKKKFKVWHIVLLIGIGIIVAYPQIKFYFVDNDMQARTILLQFGIRTARRYFPLGAGFASYGTYQARIYRSSLYAEYGFNHYYGLSDSYSDYLTDTYWPAVLGEFGVFGVIIMLLIIIIMFFYIFKKTKSNRIIFFAISYQLITILSSSIATASLINDIEGFLLIAIAASELEKRVNNDFLSKDTRNYNRSELICHTQ